jgi:hypothetical protein
MIESELHLSSSSLRHTQDGTACVMAFKISPEKGLLALRTNIHKQHVVVLGRDFGVPTLAPN